MPIIPVHAVRFLVLITLSLLGCGGGDYSVPTPGPPNPDSAFSLSQVFPGDHAGRLVVQSSDDVSNQWRAPDAFSADPYCLVRYSNLMHESGRTYEMAVAFSAVDHRVLAITLNHRPTSWFVASFDPGSADASIDLARRVVRLQKARSTQGDQVGWQATFDGSASFPATPQTTACG